MAEAGGYNFVQSKHKAINALLPYAVLQERDGRPQMLDAFLCAARASRMLKFGWSRARQYASTLLSKASPRALALASPHVRWEFLTDRGDLVQRWAAATSMVLCTDEVAQNVLDTMLQIASQDALLPYIPTDFWFWLTKRPSLPPVCLGRDVGAHLHVAKAVRGLGDIEITKAYLLLIWSEWDYLASGGFDESCASVREDFGGVENGHHRAGLIQHLDHVLAQLDRGLEYLQQHNPNLGERDFRMMKDQYGKLKNILLETNIEAVTRASYPTMGFPRILTQGEIHRISRNIYVQASVSVPIILYPEPSILFRPHPLLCPHVGFVTRLYPPHLTAPFSFFTPS